MIPILIRLDLGIFFHLDSMLWAEFVTSLLIITIISAALFS